MPLHIYLGLLAAVLAAAAVTVGAFYSFGWPIGAGALLAALAALALRRRP